MGGRLSARSRTKQLIIQLDNLGQRQAQASGLQHGGHNLSLPDGRQVRVLRSFSSNGLVVELPEEVSLEEANQMAAEMSSGRVLFRCNRTSVFTLLLLRMIQSMACATRE